MNSTCWCLKAVNDFVPHNELKNGYFGSDESLSACIMCINKDYPSVPYQIKHLDENVQIGESTKILIEEVPF